MVKDSLEPNGRSPNGLTATLDIRAGALAAKPKKTTRRETVAERPAVKEAPEANTQSEPESVDQEDSSADVPADDVKEEAPTAAKASPFGKSSTNAEEAIDDEETDTAPAKPVSGSSIFSKAS